VFKIFSSLKFRLFDKNITIIKENKLSKSESMALTNFFTVFYVPGGVGPYLILNPALALTKQ